MAYFTYKTGKSYIFASTVDENVVEVESSYETDRQS